MIKKFRLKFEPVRVIESSTTEGTPAQQYIEATVVADQHDKSLHHDELWKTPGPVGQLTLTIHQPEAITLFGRRQPFYAELLLEDGKEAPSKSKKSPSPKSGSATRSSTSRSTGKSTRKRPKKTSSRASSTTSTASRRSSRSKPKSSTPSTETVKRKAAGSRTSATPVQPQPVTTPGGNE